MHSQYGEDDLILERLERLERFQGRVTGNLLEIGAWDPVTFSNSRALIERGWNAVLIEPSPGPLKNLAREYFSNERVKVIGAAVTVEGGLIEMAVTDDAVSMDAADSMRMKTWLDSGGFIGRIHMPSLSMAQLLHQFGGAFEFVSIDTEGTSCALFAEMLRIGARPLVCMVEHDNNIVELNQQAEAAHYRQVHLNGTNVIFEYTGAWV